MGLSQNRGAVPTFPPGALVLQPFPFSPTSSTSSFGPSLPLPSPPETVFDFSFARTNTWSTAAATLPTPPSLCPSTHHDAPISTDDALAKGADALRGAKHSSPPRASPRSPSLQGLTLVSTACFWTHPSHVVPGSPSSAFLLSRYHSLPVSFAGSAPPLSPLRLLSSKSLL